MPLIKHVERKSRQISVSPYSLLQKRQKTYTIQFASRAGIPVALYLPLHYHHGIFFFVDPFLSLLSSICWSIGGWIVPKALQGSVDRKNACWTLVTCQGHAWQGGKGLASWIQDAWDQDLEFDIFPGKLWSNVPETKMWIVLLTVRACTLHAVFLLFDEFYWQIFSFLIWEAYKK